MTLIHLEPIDKDRGRAVILSLTEPPARAIYGEDVDGIDDDYYTFETGSIIVTPSKSYIAYEPSVFTAQER